MKGMQVGVVNASFGLLLAAWPALAHHSFAAEYDSNKVVKVTGIVKKVEWTNPHSRMYLEAKDAHGVVAIRSQSRALRPRTARIWPKRGRSPWRTGGRCLALPAAPIVAARRINS